MKLIYTGYDLEDFEEETLAYAHLSLSFKNKLGVPQSWLTDSKSL